MKAMCKQVKCMEQIDGLKCHDTFTEQYGHETHLGFRIQRNHKTASDNADDKKVKRVLVKQPREIFVKQWKAEKDAKMCVLTRSESRLCNRCYDPKKDIKSKVPLHKQKSKAGSIGKNCPCKMNIQYYTLYKDTECKESVGQKVIIRLRRSKRKRTSSNAGLNSNSNSNSSNKKQRY
eukprot:597715_1